MIKINLLPEKMLRRRKILPFITFVAMLASLGVLICFFLFYPVTKQVKLVRSQLALLQKQVRESQLALNELRRWEKKRDALKLRLKALENLTINQSFWPEVLYTISRSLPQTIWLTGIKKAAQEEDSILIEGNSLNQAVDIAIFMKRLYSSPIFEDVEFSDISHRKINGKEVAGFKIKCKLSKMGKK